MAAAAHAIPTYSRKTGHHHRRRVNLCVIADDERPADALQIHVDAIRMLPPRRAPASVAQAFVQLARETAATVGAEMVLEESLAHAGLGGIWGVGKAASHPPALVVLEYAPDGEKTIGWVGKGIVYDTGGLSIKSKTGMPGMKWIWLVQPSSCQLSGRRFERVPASVGRTVVSRKERNWSERNPTRRYLEFILV